MGAKHTASFFQAKEVNPMRCNLCPRQCGALRTETAGEGRCRMPGVPVVARAALHMWEEPPISGTNGSGTVFFSGCSLGCVFCQNHRISQEDLRTIEAQLLSSMQNITGNWAGMLMLNYPAPSVFEPEEHLIEPEPEKAMPSEIDLAAPAPPIEAARNCPASRPAPPPADDDEENQDEPDNDGVSGEEDEETLPEMHSSLIGDPEEYRKACSEPAVRMIDDLFGGNVVEIHSI